MGISLFTQFYYKVDLSFIIC